MIPTLIGITIVSFCIMQLAPGDPLRSKLTAQGAQGQSTGTREAYLIQKRDLKLDKPLLLNLRNFYDYRNSISEAAFYRSRTEEEIAAFLADIAADPQSTNAAKSLRFLWSLDIEDLRERLSDPAKRQRLASAIRDLVQIYCEDTGQYGVATAMELLQSDESDARNKIGLINCIDDMVVEAHKYTYSRRPSDGETPIVTRVWNAWWDRNKANFPPLDVDRCAVLKQQLEIMAFESSRERLFQLLEEDYIYDRNDMPFFAETLLGESAMLEGRAIAAIILNLYISRPLKSRVASDATLEEINNVTENWLAHYAPRRSHYEPRFLGKLHNLFCDTQYAHMVWRLVTFQFGRSALKTKEPVGELILRAFIVSAPLMLMAQFVIYFVSVPLGIVCSVNRGNLIDRLLSLKLFFLYSVPPFVAGTLFLLFFCYGDYLKWFPMDRLHSDGSEKFGWMRFLLDYLWHAFLPVTCLSLFSLAAMAMYARSSMLDVISQDYIRTARAKGVPSARVIYKHGLRNALIPILTLFSNFLPAMLGGSVLIEYIFSIPGMGRLSWESIEQKDFPTLMALIYVQAIVVLVSILLTDILYVFADPRISFEGRGKS